MRVRRAVVDAIAAHARRDSPRECCGLLVGNEHEAIEAVAVANVADDPLRRFLVSPEEHLALIRRCRTRSSPESRLDVVGAYHSHPHTTATPSATDHDQACRDFLLVIAGPVNGTADVPVRGYRLSGTTLEEVQLVVVD